MDLNDPLSAVIPSLEGRVLKVLARTDLPLSGSRIASFIPSASNAGVRNAIGRLVEQGIVLSSPAPPALLYVANRKNLLWDAIEHLVFASDGAPRKLADLLAEAVRDALGDTEVATTSVALFGSTARGDNRPDSDIDLLLVTRRAETDSKVGDLVARIIDDVQDAVGNEANVYPASRARLDELVKNEDPMVASWIADARTLSGPDVVRRLKGGAWPAS